MTTHTRTGRMVQLRSHWVWLTLAWISLTLFALVVVANLYLGDDAVVEMFFGGVLCAANALILCAHYFRWNLLIFGPLEAVDEDEGDEA